MVAVNTVILLILAGSISAFVDSLLGFDDGIMMYDWRTETMVLKPTRYDIMLNILIRS